MARPVYRFYPAVVLSLLLLSVLAGGCASPSAPTQQQQTDAQAPPGRLDSQHIELIVADLVSAMVQVRELPPLNITLQVSTPRGVFGRQLVATLEAAGYGLQYVSEDQGSNYVSYANRTIQSNVGYVQDFSVRVGDVELRREYSAVEGKVVPTSIMYIKGTRSFDNIVLNDSIFLQQGGELEFENGVEVELHDASVITASVAAVRQAEGQAGDSVELDSTLRKTRSGHAVSLEQQLLDNRSRYKPLSQITITFTDDSLLLGRKNKSMIKKLRQEMDFSKDAVFINSCGGSRESAAQIKSRSDRIIEEFLLRGVPRELVAEEGCIGTQYPDGVIIPRTTMVMLRRLQSPGQHAASSAAAFPVRPLTMTIPYGAGGATDFQARIVTMVAAEQTMLGQPITIINKPGLGGRAGWSWFAETAADSGYDLATYNVPHFIAQSIKFGTPYNIDTLEPLGNWGADPAVLVVAANSPFRTLRDYLLFARRNPAAVTVSGAGLYVGHHIAFLQLEKATGIKLDYRVAKGGADALDKVISGEVMSGFNNLSDVYRRGSELRALAIADLSRHEYLPAVPTFRELVVDIDDSSVNYRGIMVPRGTPQDVIETLSATMLKMFNSPLVNERMREGGSPLRIMSREQVVSMWQERQAYLTELLKGL